MPELPYIEWYTGLLFRDDDDPTILDVTLATPLEVRYGNLVLVVPAGFSSDGASIPRFLWRVVGPPLWGRYRRPAIIHDAGYRGALHVICDDGIETEAVSRLWCDRVFRDLMQERQVGWAKRNIMYRGVRLGGWKAFHDGHRADDETDPA